MESNNFENVTQSPIYDSDFYDNKGPKLGNSVLYLLPIALIIIVIYVAVRKQKNKSLNS